MSDKSKKDNFSEQWHRERGLEYTSNTKEEIGHLRKGAELMHEDILKELEPVWEKYDVHNQRAQLEYMLRETQKASQNCDGAMMAVWYKNAFMSYIELGQKLKKLADEKKIPILINNAMVQDANECDKVLLEAVGNFREHCVCFDHRSLPDLKK